MMNIYYRKPINQDYRPESDINFSKNGGGQFHFAAGD